MVPAVQTPFLLHAALLLFIQPLSLLAIIFFSGVLNRRRLALSTARNPLLLVLCAALLQLGVMQGLASRAWMTVAILLSLLALGFTQRLIAAKPEDNQRPNPALAWYQAALLWLAVGQLALLPLPWMDAWRAPLEGLHAQLGLYGFLVVAGIASLQILLPALTRRADPTLSVRLCEDLPIACFGVALLGAGLWLHPLIGALGLVCLSLPVLRIFNVWWRLYRAEILSLHGMAPVLAAALLGLLCVLFAALLDRDNAGLFIACFFFPLLAGAASWLLPLWQLNRVDSAPARLEHLPINHWGGVRGGLYAASALAYLLVPDARALLPALLAFVWFSWVLVRWLHNAPPALPYMPGRAAAGETPGKR